MVTGMETSMVNAKVLGLFSNATFANRPRMIIQDSDFHFDEHFEAHLMGNGL